GGVQVFVSPPAVTLIAPAATTFSATVSGTTDQVVIWSVLEANGGTIDALTGRYLATVTAGTYHVYATSHADSTKHGQAIVTIPGQTGCVLAPGTTPTTSPYALNPGKAGTPYFDRLTPSAGCGTYGNGGQNDFSETSGALPPGLKVNSDGSINGTPTAA